jgi:hypothetical protein
MNLPNLHRDYHDYCQLVKGQGADSLTVAGRNGLSVFTATYRTATVREPVNFSPGVCNASSN